MVYLHTTHNNSQYTHKEPHRLRSVFMTATMHDEQNFKPLLHVHVYTCTCSCSMYMYQANTSVQKLQSWHSRSKHTHIVHQMGISPQMGDITSPSISKWAGMRAQNYSQSNPILTVWKVPTLALKCSEPQHYKY